MSKVLISANNLFLSFGELEVLKNASLSVHEGDKIGLIGKNGAGKSSFLKIINDSSYADSGEVSIRNGIKIGYLSQKVELDMHLSPFENIRSGAQEFIGLLQRYENLPADSNEKFILEEKITRLNAWNIETLVHDFMKLLGIEDTDGDLTEKSGGELRRIALAKILIGKPDVLILDEPTNHLDTKSIEWLENLLINFEGTCLFVTHDRYFLDKIATKIVELENGEFITYQGNYTKYLELKEHRISVLEAEEEKRQKFIKNELNWILRGPKARTSKSKSRIDNFYNVKENKIYEKESEINLIIPQGERLSKKVLELNDIAKSYGGKKLFEHLNYSFQSGRRLGIVGENGCGKSTLLKIIIGSIKPDFGKVETGENTYFNYIDQNRIKLNDEDSVIYSIGEGKDYVLFEGKKLNIYTYLKRFSFTDERLKVKVGQLSGGEKSRLTLAKMFIEGGNFLVLDEPTNDLDLQTLRILEEALARFDGCVVVVSHDRYFLNRVCNGILAFEEGKVFESEGNYDYYIEKRNLRRKETKEKKETKENTNYKKREAKKLTWKEERELESIEEKIACLEEKVSEIEELFTKEDFYEKYGTQVKELNEKLNLYKEEIDNLFVRWEELEIKKNN